MYHLRRFGIYAILVIFMVSCNEEEPIPAYIYIKDISVVTNQNEGSASENIVDAWVYQNDNVQGVYQLPIEFPILAQGPTRLSVYGGITLNGISNTRAAYPLYRPDTMTVNLIPGMTDTIQPVVGYSKNAVFDMVEDFEDNINDIDNLDRIVGDPNVFEGNGSAIIPINDSSTVTAESATVYYIPATTSAAFVELDYKSNYEFQVGITAFLAGAALSINKITVTPKEQWNKIYINFTPEITQVQADYYKIFFKVVPQINPGDIKIYLDNIKLIHLP